MCRCFNPISRFQRPCLPFGNNNQVGGNGNNTKAGGNTVIVLGDNYAPINGGGNVNNGGIGCANNSRGCGGFGGKQEFAFLAKIMQFFVQMMALMSLQNQACGESCGCGNSLGLDCLG